MVIKNILTADLKMKKVIEMAESVAVSRAAVLIQGESGTGKELLAKLIHNQSNRAARSFVAINCAAVPEGLLESELFGYERGAFTGADNRKIGKFELAHLSTLMLDEISELPLHLQSKLLRVLQESEIERVGGSRPIAIDVRIIAATNKNLADQVQQGKFREDLFYRLNVIPLSIPPLRARTKDIEILAKHFIDQSCTQNQISQKVLSESALVKLKSWAWPGNIRELQNVIERSVLLAGVEVLEAEHLLIENYTDIKTDKGLQPGMTVQEAERLLIEKTLEHTAHNRTQAAYMLGISIRTLRNKLNEYKLGEKYE